MPVEVLAILSQVGCVRSLHTYEEWYRTIRRRFTGILGRTLNEAEELALSKQIKCVQDTDKRASQKHPWGLLSGLVENYLEIVAENRGSTISDSPQNCAAKIKTPVVIEGYNPALTKTKEHVSRYQQRFSDSDLQSHIKENSGVLRWFCSLAC